MIEMYFSVALFGVAGFFIAALLVEVARHSQSSLAMIPSELSSYRVLDRIRTELLSASAQGIEIEGSPVVVDGRQIALEGHAVTFTNPARERRSRIWFEDGECFLNRDIDSDISEAIVLSSNLEEVAFRFPDRIDRRRVEILVSSAATVSSTTRARDRVNVHSDIIMLRN